MSATPRRYPLAFIAFLVAVLAPIVLFGFDGPWLNAGGIEGRGRRPFPERINPSVFRLIDAWFVDRIGLRYSLISLGTTVHVGILSRSTDRRVAFGRDGWLFWPDDSDKAPPTMIDLRGGLRLRPSEVQRVEARLSGVRDALSQCGRHAFTLVAPNKQSIYREFVFGGDGPRPQSRLDDLRARLSDAARATLIDPRQDLLAARQAHPGLLIYPRTDTHWSDLGAFYVYRRTIETIAGVTPVHRAELASLDNYDIETRPSPGGDIALRMLLSPWRFPDQSVHLRPKPGLPEGTMRLVNSGEFVITNPEGRGRLLLVGDSFAPSLATFLAVHFATVHVRLLADLDGAVIAQTGADVVLYETAERYLPRLIAEPRNLERACER